MKIAYVEHPVSKKEKLELLKSKGFDKVLDIRFAPAELPEGCEKFEKPKKKAKKEK